MREFCGQEGGSPSLRMSSNRRPPLLRFQCIFLVVFFPLFGCLCTGPGEFYICGETGRGLYPRTNEIMAGARRRCERPLTCIFGRYSRLVVGIALRIMGDHGEAKRRSSDLFLCCIKKGPLYDPAKGTAKGWVVADRFRRARDREAHLVRRGDSTLVRYRVLTYNSSGPQRYRTRGRRKDSIALNSRAAFEELTPCRSDIGTVFPLRLDLRENWSGCRSLRQCGISLPCLERCGKASG